MAGIYLHIPFCKQACSYCDFYFVTRTGYRDRFVDRLIEEIRSYGDGPYTGTHHSIETVYFGGGTPSLLGLPAMERILTTLRDTFCVEPEEVTVEMNPDDVTEPYLSGLDQLGVNRASMGVQSFKPELLEFMHRAHNRREALQSLELLHAAGFDTFTVDLIYGIPGQTMVDLEEDLDTLLRFSPPHVSAYSLTVEPGTCLGKQVELGRIQPPDDETTAGHFDAVADRLQEAGIEQYEVSNFSRPGQEALHNSNYWRHENYLGFGPAAHSFWWDDEPVRWKNVSDLRTYLEKPAGSLREREPLTPDQLAEERLMMGLRTRRGVGFDEMRDRYGYEFSERQLEYLDNREKEGKVILDEQGFRLTREGLKITDTLVLDLVTL